jgi:hypothetical protein
MTDSQTPTMHSLWLPDEETCRAIGAVVVAHGHLNHILIRTIRTFAALPVDDVEFNLDRKKMPHLRQQIDTLARDRLGDSEAYDWLRELLDRCEQVTEARNTLVHDLWSKDLDDGAIYLVGIGGRQLAPPATSIMDLADAITSLVKAVNDGRLNGLIADALKQRERARANG